MTEDNIVLYDTAEAVKPQAPEIPLFSLVEPDHPALHKALPEFDFANPPVDPDAFASSLVETCKKHHGIGLSANQCGFEHRVFVMGADENYIACFNPKIISSTNESHMPEGCLSFPFLELRITRPANVTVEYQDFTGASHTATFGGITARCFQHELDHMDGIVYTSRVKPLALQSGLKKLEKIRKKYFNPKMMKRINEGPAN
jgi:peptide deformylase